MIKTPTWLSSRLSVDSWWPKTAHSVRVFWKEHSNQASYRPHFLKPSFCCQELLSQKQEETKWECSWACTVKMVHLLGRVRVWERVFERLACNFWCQPRGVRQYFSSSPGRPAASFEGILLGFMELAVTFGNQLVHPSIWGKAVDNPCSLSACLPFSNI